jgi:epoxyqueuosine reductase
MLPTPTSKQLGEIEQIVAAQAQEAGFTRAGVARVPPPGHDSYQELEYVAGWVEHGHAGEMEYLKRRDEENRLLRSSLRLPFPWVRSVIVCAANYHADAVRSLDPAPRDRGWVARYAWTGFAKAAGPKPAGQAAAEQQSGASEPLQASDYHDVLLGRLKKLDQQLQNKFGRYESRCFVDTGPLVERVYAKYAGIGWIGKNTCMINQELGSWFFLGVILTALELPQASGRSGLTVPADRCGSCTRCIDACPTDALIAPYQMDASLCIAYLTIEKRGAIPEALRSRIGRQVFGCDICQDVCPWNRRAPISEDTELALRPELVNPALDWLAELDTVSFRRLFRHSPMSRTKLSGLLRNVAIAMGNSGLDRFLPKLREWSAGEDPVLAEAATWAIRQIKGAENTDRAEVSHSATE